MAILVKRMRLQCHIHLPFSICNSDLRALSPRNLICPWRIRSLSTPPLRKSSGQEGWAEYLAGLTQTADATTWTYGWYRLHQQPDPTPDDSVYNGQLLFGCFSFAIRETTIIRPHFIKNDFPGLHPLSAGRVAMRKYDSNGCWLTFTSMCRLLELWLAIRGYIIWRLTEDCTHPPIRATWRLTRMTNFNFLRFGANALIMIGM